MKMADFIRFWPQVSEKIGNLGLELEIWKNDKNTPKNSSFLPWTPKLHVKFFCLNFLKV